MWLLLPQEAFWAVLGKPRLRTTALGTVRAWDGVDVPRHQVDISSDQGMVCHGWLPAMLLKAAKNSV